MPSTCSAHVISFWLGGGKSLVISPSTHFRDKLLTNQPPALTWVSNVLTVCQSYTGFLSSVTQPVVGALFVSNLTSEKFQISWNGTEGKVDGFVLEIIDSDWLMEPKEYNLSSNVHSYEVSGLRANTDYIAYLYGTYKGSRTDAVSVVASTGTFLSVSQVTEY